MVWQKGQARVGAGGRPMPDPVIEVKKEEEEKPVSKKTTSSKSKKTEKKVEDKE